MYCKLKWEKISGLKYQSSQYYQPEAYIGNKGLILFDDVPASLCLYIICICVVCVCVCTVCIRMYVPRYMYKVYI